MDLGLKASRLAGIRFKLINVITLFYHTLSAERALDVDEKGEKPGVKYALVLLQFYKSMQ